MKKKVLYGVFMACCAALPMGTLQSCTDDLADFEQNYVLDQNKLNAAIADLQRQVNENKTACEQGIAGLKSEINALEGRIAKNEGDIAALKIELNEKYTDLLGKINDKVSLDKLQTELNNLETSLKGYVDAKDQEIKDELAAQVGILTQMIQTEISNLGTELRTEFNTSLNDLKTQVNTQISQLQSDVATKFTEVHTKLAALEAMDETLRQGIQSNSEQITNLLELINELQEEYTQLYSYLEEAFGQIESTQQFITQVLNTLTERIDEVEAELQGQIDEVKTGLEALEDRFDALTLRINDLITSIILQGTDSPVFGNFSLPIGVQGNMLFNWYFENLGEGYSFPNAGKEYAYNAEKLIASPEDFQTAMSKGSTYAVPQGYTETNLGKLYLTLNPIGHNLTQGKTFVLETSKGAEGRLPYDLTVTPSDDELFFGVRSVENGFYETQVTIPAEAEAIAATKINIDQELKDAVKAVLNDRSKRTALNLIKAAWDQVNGTFPSYALRADWAYKNMTSYSVLSKYELGIATAKPLSFKFLDGKGTDHRLRTFGHIQNLFYTLLEDGDLNFTIDASGYHMNITIKPVNQTYIGAKDIAIVVDNKTYYPENVDGINASINEGVNEALKEAGKDITEDVNEQIDKIVADITGKINGKINNALTQAGDKAEPWFQRLNKLVDLYNRVANKVNDFLKEPNEYLQPAMFYKADGRMGIVSMAIADPTIFVNGGGQAFELIPSTYTAELAAPVYKKFIACINVVNADGKSYAANGREMAKKINASCDKLSVVLDGSAHRIFVPTSEFKAAPGQYYEFLYQALDYSGVTSTRKFYIKVK